MREEEWWLSNTEHYAFYQFWEEWHSENDSDDETDDGCIDYNMCIASDCAEESGLAICTMSHCYNSCTNEDECVATWMDYEMETQYADCDSFRTWLDDNSYTENCEDMVGCYAPESCVEQYGSFLTECQVNICYDACAETENCWVNYHIAGTDGNVDAECSEFYAFVDSLIEDDESCDYICDEPFDCTTMYPDFTSCMMTDCHYECDEWSHYGDCQVSFEYENYYMDATCDEFYEYAAGLNTDCDEPTCTIFDDCSDMFGFSYCEMETCINVCDMTSSCVVNYAEEAGDIQTIDCEDIESLFECMDYSEEGSCLEEISYFDEGFTACDYTASGNSCDDEDSYICTVVVEYQGEIYSGECNEIQEQFGIPTDSNDPACEFEIQDDCMELVQDYIENIVSCNYTEIRNVCSDETISCYADIYHGYALTNGECDELMEAFGIPMDDDDHDDNDEDWCTVWQHGDCTADVQEFLATVTHCNYTVEYDECTGEEVQCWAEVHMGTEIYHDQCDDLANQFNIDLDDLDGDDDDDCAHIEETIDCIYELEESWIEE